MSQQTSSRWDLGRFVKTLTYFDVIPFLRSIDFLNILSDRTSSVPVPSADRTADVILVVGATGGVGKRVVRRLTEAGYKVRSLVRDIGKARSLLGEEVEIVDADITVPATLNALGMQDVRAIVCCTGIKVQPVGGDTPNREKYYQGIKFYLPEVVDSPELVEYEGIKNLLQAAKGMPSQTGKKVVFDFTQPSADLRSIWGALDDVVMGGVSESNIRLVASTALFSGNVSTANSGGFASVRTRNFEPALNLAEYEGIELRVKGDGNRYKFMLRTEPKWDGIAYCYSFDTTADRWTNVRIPFNILRPIFRAKTVKDASKVDPSRICAFQLMLSKFEYDGALNPNFSAGFFQLQIEAISAYGGKTLPQFVLVSSAGVTRPGRTDLNLEEEPPAVRMNDMLGGILTWKLRGEETVRQSGIPYTIIRPCALTEEPGGKSLQVDRGDRLKGRVSREDISEMCVRALSHPQACNVTFEVAEGDSGCLPGDWAGLFSQLQPDR